MGTLTLKLKFVTTVEVGDIAPETLETVTRPRKAKVMKVSDDGTAKVKCRFFDEDHAWEWFVELLDGSYTFSLVEADDFFAGSIDEVEFFRKC